ncbi:MAG TPA: DNA-processing protein DprA [Actinomycetota bacterium]|nr:DNA-processing protein DprA [Actinomycetota bacterium]
MATRSPRPLPGHRTVVRGDPQYPALLAETPGAPSQLYLAGERLEPAPCVAVVGTRRASKYGVEAATWIGRELAAAGVVVVSGLAAGIDAAAHRGALEGGGATLAVLGCGLDICYPRANAALYGEIMLRGTLVSEYPPGTAPAPWQFPARNRIIAGVSLGIVIVEARRDGGAMITARLGLEFGREVFAVPGLVHADTSEGPHALIRDGARLVTSAADVLEDLGCSPGRGVGGAGVPPGGPVQEALALPPVTADERRVLEVLGGHPLLLDRVAHLAGLPTSATGAVLSRLELSGLVSRHPGGRFALPVGVAGVSPRRR